jgi:hypothetical protein
MRQIYDNARFAEVDAANPEIWRLFVHFTFEMVRRGFRRYSSDAVLHRVRWETASALDDDTSFKICNNWTPFYARKFHKVYPHLEGFFITRASIADETQ